MILTHQHARYFAHELTKRSSSDNEDNLASAISAAQVDLDPQQIGIAPLGFRSPLSKGAAVAHEVGLGESIEARILLAPHWAEGRPTLPVICPANPQKRWTQERLHKFSLSSVILETRPANETTPAGDLNAIQQLKITICSSPFARLKEQHLRKSPSNLVVFDGRRVCGTLPDLQMRSPLHRKCRKVRNDSFQ